MLPHMLSPMRQTWEHRSTSTASNDDDLSPVLVAASPGSSLYRESSDGSPTRRPSDVPEYSPRQRAARLANGLSPARTITMPASGTVHPAVRALQTTTSSTSEARASREARRAALNCGSGVNEGEEKTRFEPPQPADTTAQPADWQETILGSEGRPFQRTPGRMPGNMPEHMREMRAPHSSSTPPSRLQVHPSFPKAAFDSSGVELRAGWRLKHVAIDEGAERFEGSHRGEAATTSNEDADSEAMGMDESTGA